MSGAKKIIGEKELDKRFRTLPEHPKICAFTNGISQISQWTGSEAKSVQQVFVGVLVGAANAQVVKATPAFVDFVYLASYHSHTTETLM